MLLVCQFVVEYDRRLFCINSRIKFMYVCIIFMLTRRADNEVDCLGYWSVKPVRFSAQTVIVEWDEAVLGM